LVGWPFSRTKNAPSPGWFGCSKKHAAVMPTPITTLKAQPILPMGAEPIKSHSHVALAASSGGACARYQQATHAMRGIGRNNP
jgi:hypothetical protein